MAAPEPQNRLQNRIEPPDLDVDLRTAPQAAEAITPAGASPVAAGDELRELTLHKFDLSASPPIRRIERCVLNGCLLRDIDWRGGRGVQISDSRLVGCDLANAKLTASALRRIEFIDCRMTGIDLSDASLTDVSLVRCRADLSVMFSTAATRVRFEACDLRQAEFDSVTFDDVSFLRCNLAEARFVRPRLNRLDLRGSSLQGLQIPPESLRGTTIDLAQAPFIASLLGIRISHG